MSYPYMTFVTAAFSPDQELQLQQFIAILRGFLSKEHKDDGAHSALTADSLTVPSPGKIVGSFLAAESGSGFAAFQGTTSIFAGDVLFSGTLSCPGIAPSFGIGFTERGRSTAAGEFAAYTVDWTSTGTAPSIGNGTLTGKYALIGKTCFFNTNLNFGSTSSAGTGIWRFSLPVTAAGTTFTGGARILDSGTQHYTGAINGVSTTTFSVIYTGNTGSGVGAGLPITWATGDGIWASGFYEIA